VGSRDYQEGRLQDLQVNPFSFLGAIFMDVGC
jgi:hypothetical protein